MPISSSDIDRENGVYPRKAYEYKRVNVSHYDLDEVNRLARSGWRLVSLNDKLNYALMERQILG